jgi:hypothetical protein
VGRREVRFATRHSAASAGLGRRRRREGASAAREAP